MSELVIFEAPQYAAALLGQEGLGLGQDLTGGLGGGTNRISLKGSRFRLIQAGQEVAVLEQSYLDVVIVGSAKHVSRIYYKDKYNSQADKVKPSCWSADGVTPAAAATEKQSVNCASCKQNIKGSATSDNGIQSRACAFRKRIVVVSNTQLGNEQTPEPYALDVNSLSLFGAGIPSQNKYSLGGYGTFLNTPRQGFEKGISPLTVVTRLTLDSDSSVPKLFFFVATNSAGRAAFLSETQIRSAVEVAKSEQVRRLVEESTADLLTPEIAEQTAQQVTAAAPVPPPPPPPPATWQQVATENGVDSDDIEMIESVGGPTTEKGRKRWDKLVPGVEPPEGTAASLAEQVKVAKPVGTLKSGRPAATPKQAATGFAAPAATPAEPVATKNPFSASTAPAPASTAAKPQGVSADVGAKLASQLSAFDDE